MIARLRIPATARARKELHESHARRGRKDERRDGLVQHRERVAGERAITVEAVLAPAGEGDDDLPCIGGAGEEEEKGWGDHNGDWRGG